MHKLGLDDQGGGERGNRVRLKNQQGAVGASVRPRRRQLPPGVSVCDFRPPRGSPPSTKGSAR